MRYGNSAINIYWMSGLRVSSLGRTRRVCNRWPKLNFTQEGADKKRGRIRIRISLKLAKRRIKSSAFRLARARGFRNVCATESETDDKRIALRVWCWRGVWFYIWSRLLSLFAQMAQFIWANRLETSLLISPSCSRVRLFIHGYRLDGGKSGRAKETGRAHSIHTLHQHHRSRSTHTLFHYRAVNCESARDQVRIAALSPPRITATSATVCVARMKAEKLEPFAKYLDHS